MFKNNKVTLLILLIIAAFVGYNYFLKKDKPTNGDLAVESQQQDQNGQPAIGKDLMAALFKLKSLTIDDTFFKDPIFNSLTDFTVQIAPQEVGRNNPFSSVGGASVIRSGKGL
ncbi:MAG: hypothetical protein KGJ58_02215 [Patescibacteria group bacterium]|nr:hypothetical protein [Patescibacteria group bacterium]MDE1988610.1 hypothetical protein [Patescibacteria group bacterium]MDE2218241.1 hypothetical protein [Patescibacteria group bacterium]